ncbi:MAG: ribonuclease E [Spongiibacteraceae bacterium]|nr:ribonuclease E [Spongiibacteraceae bacterium]
MKRMLINATQPEELRVALVDGQRLYDLDIENRTRIQKKSNIYKGTITRVEPSLEAAFVDFGAERHGFLPLKEIAREYFYRQPSDIGGKMKIKDVVREGTEVIVQVDKEERGNKGAALTTFISIAGRYLVLMPNNPRAGGISRRIEGEERNELRDALSSIEIPDGMGVIVRTAGVGRQPEELQLDLDYLLHLWESVTAAAKEKKAPFLILQESNVIIRAIRDYLRQDIDQLLIDNEDAYNQGMTFIRQVMPHFQNRIKLYQDPVPLFNRYQIEAQIETAYQREVKLPSGGSIVIDPTEAMVAIDINSARATKGEGIEETALQTNLEAADEIARQLRLRDIGGLIVIDFIDMGSTRNQRDVETRMRDALQADRARVQLGRISRFGLLEMSRQRLRPSLEETSARVCPRCSGQGMIRDTKSLALSILRLVEEEANKERSAEIRAIVPVDVAAYLLNEKRQAISDAERRTESRIVIVPSALLETPHFEVQRLRDDEIINNAALSFEIEPEVTADDSSLDTPHVAPPQQAAVQALSSLPPAPAINVEPAQQAPSPAPVALSPGSGGGLLGRIKQFLFGVNDTGSDTTEAEQTEPSQTQRRVASSDRSQSSNRRRGTRGGRSRQSERGRDGSRDSSRENGRDNREARDTRDSGREESRSNRDDNRGSRDDSRTSRETRDTSRDESGQRRSRSSQRRDDDSRSARSDRPRREQDVEATTDVPDTGTAQAAEQPANDNRPARRPGGKRTRSPAPRQREGLNSQETDEQDTGTTDSNVQQASAPENTVENTPASSAPARDPKPAAQQASLDLAPAAEASESVETSSAADDVAAPAKPSTRRRTRASAETDTNSPAESQTDVAAETPVAVKTEPRVNAEVESEAKPEAKAQPEAQVQPEADAQPEAALHEQTESQPAAKAEPEARPADTAPAAPVAAAEPAAAAGATNGQQAPGRAPNDPRQKPRPTKVQVEVKTRILEVPTSSAPPVPAPAVTTSRASNDPRQRNTH